MKTKIVSLAVVIIVIALLVVGAVVFDQLGKRAPEDGIVTPSKNGIFGLPKDFEVPTSEPFEGKVPAPTAVNKIFGKITSINSRENFLMVLEGKTGREYKVLVTGQTEIAEVLLPGKIADRTKFAALDELRIGDSAEVEVAGTVTKTAKEVTAVFIQPIRL